VPKPQRHIGILGGIFGRLGKRDFRKSDLALARASDRFVADGFVPEIQLGQFIHAMALPPGIEREAHHHGIVKRVNRDAFVAEPGNVILSADYSQIELRLAAHMADVGPLREAFENSEDIHARTAQELFGEVNRDTRGRAKTINFSILYGISRWGLAKRLESTPEEAQHLIDAYFARFPGISAYIQETLASVKECGFTTTLFGRKCWFPRISSQSQAERQGSERAAINAPIQGTSADIIKRAMVRMGPALLEAGLPNVKMLLQVHDELVFELPEADVAEASRVIESVMVSAAEPLVKLSVPLGVEIGTGPSWGAAH